MNKVNCSSLCYLSGIALSGLKCFFLGFSVPLGLGIIGSYPINAQVVPNYGRSPSVTTFSPTLAPATSSFAPTNGFSCPTPNFSIGAYGGSGNDWSDEYTNYSSASSGVVNYGLSIGVSFPFGGVGSEYCKDYAESLATRAKLEMEALRRNEQITLLRQCYWFVKNSINLDQTAFKSGGAFSSFSACKDYDFASIQGGDNPGTSSKPELAVPENPPLSEIKSPPPSNLILQER